MMKPHDLPMRVRDLCGFLGRPAYSLFPAGVPRDVCERLAAAALSGATRADLRAEAGAAKGTDGMRSIALSEFGFDALLELAGAARAKRRALDLEAAELEKRRRTLDDLMKPPRVFA